VARFFQQATKATERESLLEEGRIAFVIHGPRERALGDFDPATWPALRRRVSVGDYAIYEVLR
jgi:hypothetical protein